MPMYHYGNALLCSNYQEVKKQFKQLLRCDENVLYAHISILPLTLVNCASICYLTGLWTLHIKIFSFYVHRRCDEIIYQKMIMFLLWMNYVTIV